MTGRRSGRRRTAPPILLLLSGCGVRGPRLVERPGLSGVVNVAGATEKVLLRDMQREKVYKDILKWIQENRKRS